MLPYDEYAFQYDEEEGRIPVSTQSATTQTVSVIYDPNLMSDDPATRDLCYQQHVNAAINVSTISRTPSIDEMEILRRSTLV